MLRTLAVAGEARLAAVAVGAVEIADRPDGLGHHMKRGHVMRLHDFENPVRHSRAAAHELTVAKFQGCFATQVIDF